MKAIAIPEGQKVADLQGNYTQADLIRLTNASIDHLQALLQGLPDAAVTFTPIDPAASDPYAKTGEGEIAWNLGHLIAHVTASAEEGAAISAEMARGIQREGRSRYETPWESITSIAQCLQRLEESRRIRLAYLNAWPDQPHLELLVETRWAGSMNAIGRALAGLTHETGHYAQIEDAIRQFRRAQG